MAADPIKDKQGGWTVRGLILWLAVLGAVGWLAVRIAPLYYQYWTVQAVLETQLRQAESFSDAAELRAAVRAALAARGAGEAVPASALTVTTREGSGYRLVADYQRSVVLTQRVRLVYDFRAEASSGG
jgi:hypothetical protein